MKKILCICLLLVLGYSSSSAQMITGPATGASVQSILEKRATAGQENTSPFQMQEAALPYTYYDPSAPTFAWTIGAFYLNSFFMIAIGEQISLPSSAGVVDSIQATFGSVITPDTLLVALFPDTVLQVQDGREFHFIDPNGQPFATAAVAKTDIVSGGPTTIKFDHVSVPQHFFVTFLASVNSSQTQFLPYEVLGDKEPVRTRTLENTHSGFIAATQSQSFSVLLDSLFVAPGETDPMFSNLLVTAYVESGSSGVQSYGYTSSAALKSFPNPASDKVTFVTENATASGSLELYDISGHAVWNGSINGVRQIDVTQLPSGIYNAVYRSGATSISKTVSVAH